MPCACCCTPKAGRPSSSSRSRSGIGANTALFSAVNGLLLTQIPVRDPDTLVRLRYGGRNDMVTSSSDYGFSARAPTGRTSGRRSRIPMYQQFLADNQTMCET